MNNTGRLSPPVVLAAGTVSGGGSGPFLPAGYSSFGSGQIAGVTVPTGIIFDDEFSTFHGTGTGLDPTKWDTTFFTSEAGVAWVPANVKVDPTVGAIFSLVDSGHGAGCSTINEFSLSPSAGPVYVEFAATCDGIAGNNFGAFGWPATWLTAINAHWPGDGEIDCMEGFGDFQQHAIVAGDSAALVTSENFTPGLHTFAAFWTGSHISFIVDGVVKPGAGTAASMPGPMGIVLNQNNSGSSATPISYPAKNIVRYVRVWGVSGNIVATNF